MRLNNTDSFQVQRFIRFCLLFFNSKYFWIDQIQINLDRIG